jgi:hypothetical protein
LAYLRDGLARIAELLAWNWVPDADVAAAPSTARASRRSPSSSTTSKA